MRKNTERLEKCGPIFLNIFGQDGQRARIASGSLDWREAPLIERSCSEYWRKREEESESCRERKRNMPVKRRRERGFGMRWRVDERSKSKSKIEGNLVSRSIGNGSIPSNSSLLAYGKWPRRINRKVGISFRRCGLQARSQAK